MQKEFNLGGGKRATRFTSSIATLIWCLAVICATPATFSYIRVFRVNKDVTFQVNILATYFFLFLLFLPYNITIICIYKFIFLRKN